MSVIVKHIPHTVDLNENIKKTYIDTLLATEDNLAHCFDITLKQDGQAVALPDGTDVTAYFIRYCDNATLPAISGTVSGNVVSATLNKACYNKAGQFAVIIKVEADGVTNTVFYGEGTILTSMTDTILDPENVVPSLSDLLAQISAMEAATAASKTATTNAKTATTRANNAAAKIEGMTASAVDAEEAGVTVSEVGGVKHFAFELPKGPKGDPGTIENVTITSIAGLPEALDSLSQQIDDLSVLSKIHLTNVKSILRTDVVDSTWYLQGGAWVDCINAFIIAFRSSEEVAGTTEVLLAVCDEHFNVTATKQVNAGHANDIAYNPNVNRIYIATGDHGANANSIVEVNPYTLEVANVHPFDNPCWQISYSRVGRYFLANFGGKLRKLDESLNTVREVDWNTPDWFNEKYVAQGSFFYKDKFYFVGYGYNEIIIMEIDENGIVRSKFIENIGANESEIVDVRGDELFVFAGQNVLKSFKADLKNDSASTLAHLNNAGVEIPSNTDLNTIALNVGKYLSSGGDVTATLINKPPTLTSSDGGFTMTVEPLAFDRFVNYIVASSGRTFKRTWSTYTGWFAWEEIISDKDVLSLEEIKAGADLDKKVPSAQALADSAGRIGKLLWTGSFSEGSITVPGLESYTLIAIKAASAIMIGSKNYGIGGNLVYGGTQNATIAYRFNYPATDTLAINDIDRGCYASDGTMYPITAIYGIF